MIKSGGGGGGLVLRLCMKNILGSSHYFTER